MRVLVIEDTSAPAVDLTHRLLREGFTVEVATCPRDGERKARAGAYDVIVLDLMLPHLDCVSMVKRWRKGGLKSPVLILVDPADVADAVRGMGDLVDLEMDDFMTKPYRYEEIMVRLRVLCRRSQSVVLRICDLEIDTVSRLVKRAGKPIYLTPREYSLLHFLARRRGSVVTHSQIHAGLYQDLDENGSNVIAVYIRYLRAKIDKGFELPLILTRWGQGYLVRGEAG